MDKTIHKPYKIGLRVSMLFLALTLAISACNFPQQVLVPVETEPVSQVSPTPVNPDSDIL
ncbi:MAG: hypothetical protein GX544_03090, partial [Chloroflexi bacterium]|nr:hypothetical protein [Chloroflexota bacterium]